MPSTETTHQDHSTVASATSADGTTIGYRSYGRGPGLVVVHGAMESSADYADLAAALAGSFTVHVFDRRGRGMSGPHGEAFGLATELDDVRAVVDATKAQHVFGVSSGGVIALQAGLELHTISHVACYEPALSVPSEDPDAATYVDRYEQELARGRPAAALLAFLKGAKLGPRFLRLLPRPLATALVHRLIDEEEKTAADGEVTFGSLVPTLHYDFLIGDQGSADLQRFDALDHPVLLLGGSNSPRYLTAALTALEQLLPQPRRVQLQDASHTASGNAQQGGRPDLVARELLNFLTPAKASTGTQEVS